MTMWPRPHPFQRKFFYPGSGLAVVDPLAKFKQHSLIRLRNIDGGLKFKKGRDPDHAAFNGKFLLLWWDLP